MQEDTADTSPRKTTPAPLPVPCPLGLPQLPLPGGGPVARVQSQCNRPEDMLGLMTEKREYAPEDLRELASIYCQEQNRSQGVDSEGA